MPTTLIRELFRTARSPSFTERDEARAGGESPSHTYVVGILRQFGHQFLVADHRDQPRAGSREPEGPVVEARAAAESHAPSIDGQGGNENGIGRTDLAGFLHRAGGFAQAVTRGGETVGARELGPVERAGTAGDGHEDAPGDPPEGVEKIQ